MKIKVTKDLCEIKENEIWNVGDYNVHTVEVELSDEFDGLVNKVRYFIEDNCYDMLITNNIAEVPYEATLTEGTIKIGVYGYDADTNILVQSTSPVNKYISSGTYTGEADNTEPLTPTDKQQMESAIQKNTDDIINLQNNKQDVLISGENIKTINNESILGNGNIEIDLGPINYDDIQNKPMINNVELYGNMSLSELGIQPAGNYATMNDLTEESRAIFNEIETTYYNKNQTNNLLNNKQNTLISGQNIKTINSESLLGEGNIIIQGGGSSDYEDLENLPKINNIELNGNKSLNDLGIQPAGNYALESEVPTKTSDLTNDSGFITGYIETDPTVPSYVKNITQANITSWNNKSDFSGNYNDLTNKPTIPVVPANVSAFTNDAGYLTQHQDITGKVNTSQVKNTMSTTAGDVYDVRYINTMIGNIETLLGEI